MSNTPLKEWPCRRKSVQIWVDPRFKQFINSMFPESKDPEKTRRLLDRIDRITNQNGK